MSRGTIRSDFRLTVGKLPRINFGSTRRSPTPSGLRIHHHEADQNVVQAVKQKGSEQAAGTSRQDPADDAKQDEEEKQPVILGLAIEGRDRTAADAGAGIA
jgi:hypothetical protein